MQERSRDHEEDVRLHRWIVNELPDWEEAYLTLIHRTYGGVCINAAIRTGLAGGRLAKAEDVFGLVYVHLRQDGPRGSWNALKTWNGVNPFGPWLRVVVTRLCGRLGDEPDDIALTDLVNASTSDEQDAYADLVDEVFGGVWDKEASPEHVMLMDCLQRLHTADRRGFRIVARYYVEEGFTDDDIARLEGVTREHTSRLKRAALNSLLRCLNGGHHD